MIVVALCNLVLHFEVLAALSEQPTPMTPVIYYEYPVGTVINQEDNFKNTFYYYSYCCGNLFTEYLITSCVSVPVIMGILM